MGVRGDRVSERENAMDKRVVKTIQRAVLVTLGTVLLLGLVGISVPNRVVGSLGLNHTATARLQIERFEKALELFLLDHGRYPTTAEGPQALLRNPGSMSWTGPYLSEPRIPADPWGRSYGYVSPGDHGSYDLWSLGADGLPGGTRQEQDLLNWSD